MNELKLFIENTGHTYTLKPTREYAIGSASDCEIRLSEPQVSPYHLKFSFDQFSKTWHIYDLGSNTGTLIDNQPISDYPLVAQKRVSLGSGIHLVATPEGSETTPASQPAPITTPQPVTAPPQGYAAAPPSYPTTMPAVKPAVISSEPDRALIREYFECLKKRRTAPKEQEQLGQKALDDFILSLKEKRWPQKEGRYIYGLIAILLILALFQQFIWAILLLIAGFIVAFYTVETPAKLPIPKVSDGQIIDWLLMDRENLVKKGKAELRLLETTGQEVGNILDAQPIVLISGVSEQLNEANFGNWGLLMSIVGYNNYFVEKGLDDEYKYSIYNFIAIYPCQNFIAYYRCTWNFITGFSLRDETCEYLYDSIVSVKTKELSNMSKASVYKEISYEVIEITTTDSQSIKFPVLEDHRIVAENQTFNFEKVQESSARNTAHTIRQQVRQRKPGFIKTQSVNEMRQNLLE
jgi:pSer/pThr/pTyr-binding forkhead associated (FHA) protein